jgi:hypothetical protein
VFPHREYLIASGIFCSSRGAKKLPFHLCVCDLAFSSSPRAHPRGGERIPRIPMIIQLLPVIRAINACVMLTHTPVCRIAEQETTNKSLTPFISSDLLMALSAAHSDCPIHGFLLLTWADRSDAKLVSI